MEIFWFSWFQIIALVFAVVCFRYLRTHSLGLFVPLLIGVCVVEIVGANLNLFGWDRNYIVYNLYLLYSTPLMLKLYDSMLVLSRSERMVFGVICALVLSFILLNFFGLQGMVTLNSYSIILIQVLQIVLSSIVLFQAIVLNIKQQLIYNPYFWINTGTVLFSMGTLVMLGLQPFVAENQITVSGRNLYVYVMPWLNVLLYISYTIGFASCVKRNHSLL
jgi:hypothetical protein